MLEELAALRCQQGRLHEATALAEDLLALDPYRESTWRTLMMCNARLGNRAEAVRQYHRCEEVLHDDIGVEPMPETTDLIEQIRDSAGDAIRHASFEGIGALRREIDLVLPNLIALKESLGAPAPRSSAPRLHQSRSGAGGVPDDAARFGLND